MGRSPLLTPDLESQKTSGHPRSQITVTPNSAMLPELERISNCYHLTFNRDRGSPMVISQILRSKGIARAK